MRNKRSDGSGDATIYCGYVLDIAMYLWKIPKCF